MRKFRFLLLVLFIVIVSLGALTSLFVEDIPDIKEILDDSVNSIKELSGENDTGSVLDKYEVISIEVYGYDELKKEIESHSSIENKSYVFNLHDGDYNITSMINCGYSISDAQYTINGNGHVIDGNNKHQFMKLFADLKLNDLTVKNTVPDGFNSSSVITMETVSSLFVDNCKFINNRGKTKGSSITNRGNCYITNSYFGNNSVDEVGGAIWSTGQYGGSLSIQDCVFEDNAANLQDNNDRTAIVYMVALGNNTIRDNVFVNNTGRCIHAFNQTNTLIVGNKFVDNSMVEDDVIRGGLIDNYEADITIKNNEFVNDKTMGELRGGILYHEIGDMVFADNKVENININLDPTSVSECSKGGVIFNRNASAVIEHNSFNNVLTGNYSRGGVVYNNLGNITLRENKFNNVVDGNHLRGLIVFNDVNSVLNLDSNTLETRFNGSFEAKNDEDKFFYNSNVKNDDGNGTIGITNYIN